LERKKGRSRDTWLGYSTVGEMTAQAANPNGGGMRYARYGGKFMRRRRSWKRGSERRSIMGKPPKL
jgi:hypothetical protein